MLNCLKDREFAMKKIKIKKWKVALFNTALMLSTSICGTNYALQQMANFNPEKFPEDQIVLKGYQVPKHIFYRNIFEKDGQWYYEDAKLGLVDLNEASDYQFWGDLAHRSFANVKSSVIYEKVKIRRNSKTKQEMFSYGSLDSLENMPAMGRCSWATIVIRDFYSDDPVLAQKYKIYSNEYNCTERHEMQHFLNAKVGAKRCGMSYETKFAHNCMDEVSANVAQLLAQRENYLKTGDVNRITDRFEFYRQWVVKQNKPLTAKLSEEEKSLIANGVFDAWKKDKFELYEDANVSQAEYRLKKADYNGCTDHPKINDEIMREFFHIDGMYFYKYIKGREKEFVNMLSDKYKKHFAELTQEKKKQMRYMEKLGQYTENDPARKSSYFMALKAKYRWEKTKKRSYLIKKLTAKEKS